jgi:RimJ/RimL family protein N-acetyltransferase
LWLCDIAPSDAFWKSYLPGMGFQFVDFALRAILPNAQQSSFPETRTDIRPATPADRDAIEYIASSAFQHGRYHADPRFPRDLADRRYHRWICNALSKPNPGDFVYVMIQTDSVSGFYHVSIDGAAADLRLAALHPDLQGTLLGFDLYASMMHVLKTLGVRRVTTSISASNTGVLNVYSMLGFHFSEPKLLFHRHGTAALR